MRQTRGCRRREGGGFFRAEAEWNEEVNHAEILGGRGARSRRRDKVPKCSGGNEVGSSRNKVGRAGAGTMRYTTQVRGWPDGGPVRNYGSVFA